MNVVAVVVTYNRRTLLAECLSAISSQSRPVDQLIVVDNASSDGTGEAVRNEHPHVTLVRLPDNLGGAGGFAVGIAHARPRADLIWLMDDDALPHTDALEQLIAARERYAGERPTVVASRVVSREGEPIPMNSPRVRPFCGRAAQDVAAAAGCLPIRSASFVSVLVDGEAARRHDLPVADYFLWNDDFEYTARLLRDAVGLLCPQSVTTHATSVGADPGARFRLEVRNKIWLMTRSDALTPRERAVYAGATLLRWVSTIARSSNRRLLLAGLVAGVRDASRRGPRPTAELIAAASASPSWAAG